MAFYPAARDKAAARWRKRLLSHGYFPAELPPAFSSEDFADKLEKFEGTWLTGLSKPVWTAPEIYSICKPSQGRRNLAIVNPISQAFVAHVITKNWREIKQYVSKGYLSVSPVRPVLGDGGRAVGGTNFDLLRKKKAEIIAISDIGLRVDISRFYSSIYTHSIPWALLGKDWVKQNLKTPQYKASFPALIDNVIQACQRGQTIGIPIGPDTSRILSEVIAVGVEEELVSRIPDLGLRAFRHIDDFFIGCDGSQGSSDALSAISRSLYEYQLELNDGKTVTTAFPVVDVVSWAHQLRAFRLSNFPPRQREDLDSFFALALKFTAESPKENVILFALKKAANFRLAPSNVSHLVNWMLYFAKHTGHCVAYVVKFLISSDIMHNSALRPSVEAFLLREIPKAARLGHADELAWLLYLARYLGLRLSSDSLNDASKLSSSVCAIQILHLRQMSLISGRIDDSHWLSFANSDGLNSELWMAAYEITVRGWWSRRPPINWANEKYFGELEKEGVRFYSDAPITAASVSLRRPRAIAPDVIEGLYGPTGPAHSTHTQPI